MKMRNRLFAILLAVTMVITYMPSVAFAVDPSNNDNPTEIEDQLNADEAGAPENGNDAGTGQDDGDVETDKGSGKSGDDSGDIPGEMRGAGDSEEGGDEDPSDTSSIPNYWNVIGNNSNTVSTENTASSYELSFQFECSENEASNLRGYFGIEKRYDQRHAFTIVEEDTEITYNPDGGYATFSAKIVSENGLEEGDYGCDLYFVYDRNGQEDYSERAFITGLSLDVRNYDSQAYKIYVDAPYFGTIDPELTQSEINEEYGDDKGVTITNCGTGPVKVSKDSYVIDTETSDVDAFVIEYADEDVTLDTDETWTGMTVLPKAGMEEGRYRLNINVYDETGYATDSVYIEYRVGDPLFIETSLEEVYFYYYPSTGQPVQGPSYLSLKNDSDVAVANVTVESSNSAFTASIENVEEDGSIDWQGGEWVNMTVDVTDEYPAKSAEGVITVTATTADGRSAECKINVHLIVDGSADPFFMDTETDLEFSIEEMLEAANPTHDEDEGGGQLFDVFFNPARNNTYGADLSGLIKFTLSGEDAELFNTKDFLSIGRPSVGIVPDSDYEWAAGIYEFTLNMYYDPDGNVSADGELVDSLDFKLEVYDQDDYKLTICHEDGTPVDDDEYVFLGSLIQGYDPYDGETTLVLKYDGKDPIEITPECFHSYGGFDEEADYNSNITSISFIDGVNGVKTLNKGDTYRFKVAPTAGNDIDSYYDDYEISASNGRARASLCLEYSVVHDGLYLEFFDDDEEVVLEPDESGNITADLGINATDDDGAEPYKDLYLSNMGSVPCAISIEKKSGGDENISCELGFSENDYEDYEEDTQWILDPGQNIDALVAADYEALCENEGVYRASFVVTATAVDEDNQNDTSYAPLVYTINAVYEISDEKCEVSFNFRGKGDYDDQIVEVPKGYYIDSALSELYQELGDDVLNYKYLKADGYKCIGYSYTENNNCSTWDEYYDLFNGRDRIVRSDMTVFFDWAKEADPIEMEMALPKCGDKVSDVNETLSISGGGDHISFDSVKWRKNEYNGGFITQYMQDDSVFEANDNNLSYNFEITVTPDFGWTVGDVSLNEGDVYVQVYERGNENIISGNLNVKHKITQIAGTGSTCDKTGLRNHYKCEGCDNLFKDRNGYEPAMLDELTIPAKGHKWEVSYDWAEDNSSVTATAVCSRDSGHKIQETAVAEPSTDATSCEVERHVTYTATFENPEFETQTKQDTLPAGEHSWNSGTVTKPATCTEPGKKTVTCTVCGATEERTIPALNHDYQYSRMQWTKTAEGYTAKALYVCANDSTHTETFDAEVTSKTTDATCEAAGQTVYTAAYDGHTEKKTDVIPALGHDYQYSTMEWIKTANGYTAKAVYVCANDSTHTEKHKAEVTSKTTAATCEAAGQTVYTAAYDGQTDTKTEVIPALGHNYQYSRMEWTKTESGYTAKALYVCANDSTHTEQHNAEVTSETTGATCEAAGQTVYTAAYDGNTDTKTEVIPALNHDWDDPTYVWAADNSSVTATRVCKRDGTHKETKTVSTEAESDATSCDVEKHVKYTATFEAPFTPQEKTVTVAAGEHAWNSGTVTKPATCTEAGVKTLTCNVCGETKEEPIPALNHNYQYSKMEWTKTESGYTAKALYVCANDSKHTEQHDAEVTFETTAATCETDGQTVYTARYDGNTDTKTDVIPALDHDWDEWAKISDEQHKRFCKRNNEHFETGNHVWDEGTIADPANETDKRIKTYTCSVCGGTKEEELPSLLEEAQEKARTELSKYNLNDYSGAEKTNVEKALSTAETAIARATTVETVTNALNEAKTTIAAQKTDAQKNAEASAYTPPAAPAEILDLPAVKITKPASAKKKLTVKWKKVSKKNLKKISGIQIQVATDPGFTNIVKTATAGKKKTSKKIGGLQPKTKYYVRIRAYGAANHYSVWKSKSGKTK